MYNTFNTDDYITRKLADGYKEIAIFNILVVTGINEWPSCTQQLAQQQQ